MDMLERTFGIKITYWKAWKAREIARSLVRGLPEHSFTNIASYFWLLEKENPRAVTALQTDQHNHFKQCFMAIGSCLRGFRTSIRPVLVVDACHLKGKFRGKLFLATAMDSDKHIYPIAFGVGATENDEYWNWFFTNLQRAIGCDVKDLVVISDKHPSILKACSLVFPDAVHGICMYYLGMNMKAKFKVQLDEFLYRAVKAYTEFDFNEAMHHIQHTNKAIYDYLMEAEPSKWAQSYFPSIRYNIMTTNIAEYMNVVLKEAREYSLIGMLETIRALLQRWFHDRHQQAMAMPGPMTPTVEKTLSKRDDFCRRFKVAGISQTRSHMIDGHRNARFDIMLKTYTCKVLDMSKIPCVHAIRACRERGISMYTLCSRFYSTEACGEAYALPINPLPHKGEWYLKVPQEVRDIVVKPPIMSTKVGRRRNKSMLSQGGEKQPKRCGRCKKLETIGRHVLMLNMFR